MDGKRGGEEKVELPWSHETEQHMCPGSNAFLMVPHFIY